MTRDLVMETRMLAAAALVTGQYVRLDKSSTKWLVVLVENPTGLVVHLHLSHLKSRTRARVLHVFPDELMAVVSEPTPHRRFETR